MRAAVVILLACACGKVENAAPTSAECKHALAHYVSLRDFGKNLSPAMEQWVTSIKGVITKTGSERCTADRWSGEAIDCLNKATDEKVAKDCEKFLSDAQRTSLEGALEAASKALPPAPAQ